MSETEQLATELQNAQDLLAARTREMSALERAVSVFGATMHPGQEIYRQLTDEAAKLLDVEICIILLYDAEQEVLLAQTPAVGLDDALIQSYRIPLDDTSPARPGWDSGELQVIRNALNEPVVQELGLGQLVEQASVKTILTIGLWYEGKLLGALQLCNKRDGTAFTPDDVRLVTIFASQVPVALENARLYEAAQQAHRSATEERDKLTMLHSVVLEMQRADSLRTKLQVIAEGIHQVGWGRVSVSIRDADLNVTDLVCVGFTPEDEAALRANLLPAAEWKRRLGMDLDRFRMGQCYYLPWSDPWVREHVQGVKSHMAGVEADTWHPQDLLYVPLYGRDRRIMGLIGLDDPLDGSRPTAERLHIIELFAQEIALALQNAQLLDDLRLLNTDLQEMLNTQAELLRTVEDLASPVVPIVDGVIVLPLVGHVDERRAAQILTTLLGEVEEHRAQVVILDITGVPLINSQVAHHLMQAVRASRLLGAEAILVGIRPDVAQTLVKLGVGLKQVVTRSDLQSGFQYALNVIGQRLTGKLQGEGPRP
jgi:anti-anti-sigma regulatory factor